MEDADFINRILHRDKRAIVLFYRTYQPKLTRFIRSKVASREDGEEILQDTLFAFLEALRDFNGKSNLQTFLFSICHHKIIDFYRRKKFKHLVFSQAPQVEGFVSPLLNPEEELDVVLLKEKIHRVMASLVPQYRRMLFLKYFEGVSVEDIAEKFAITFKSAESKLFRARKAFVEAFLSI